MKINWGTKIAAVYIAFVLFIGFMVFLSFQEKYNLTSEDYYAQEIAFQEKIDSKERLLNLENSLEVRLSGGNVIIDFPHADSAKIQGTINCFRPSDDRKDFNLAMENHVGPYSIPLNKFIKGKYILKLDWESNGESYYSEKIIVLP